MDDIQRNRAVQQAAFLADALAVENVELRGSERRRDLVLDDLRLRAVADDGCAVLELLAAADVDAHGRIELERTAARRRLRIAVHHADLLAKLVDEDAGRVRLVDDAGQLAQRLAHQARLQADEGIAHLAVDFGLRHKRCHRVDDHDVNRAGANQRLADFKRLLAGIRLRDVQLIDVHAQLARIDGIERVLRVDERGHTAHLLRLRDDVQRNGRLAGGFRAVDLHHAAARHAAHAQRHIQIQTARRNHLNIAHGALAHADDRALAELLFNAGQRDIQRALFFGAVVVRRDRRDRLCGFFALIACHIAPPVFTLLSLRGAPCPAP